MSGKSSSESFGGMAIFVITFLALWILLMTLMPSSFYVMSKQYSDYEVPDYFTQEDIQTIKHFQDANVTRGDTIVLDFNPDANFKFDVVWATAYDSITFRHWTWELGPFYDAHAMEVDNADYILGDWWISKSLALANWDGSLNASTFYPVRCPDITVKVWFTDPNQTRNNLSTAWDEGKVTVAMGFGFDDYETKLSAWDIVGRLLTFQSPEIFGLTGAAATVINLVITLPFYVCVAYLIYRLILLAIPFV